MVSELRGAVLLFVAFVFFLIIIGMLVLGSVMDLAVGVNGHESLRDRARACPCHYKLRRLRRPQHRTLPYELWIYSLALSNKIVQPAIFN